MKSRIEIINSYYEENYKKLEKLNEVLNEALLKNDTTGGSNINADNYKILGWESRQAQYARFSAFVKNVDINNCSVLDVGCGLGDLYHFCTSGLNLNIEYTGVDISKKMTDTAEMQLEVLKNAGLKLADDNKSSAVFECADVFKGFDKKADWVYASGIFNLNLGNNLSFLKNAFDCFKKLSNRGFVCSMLNERSDDKEKPYFYYSPEVVKSIAEELNPAKIIIDDSYLKNDFTICVFWK